MRPLRRESGKMNKTEARYAEHLELLKSNGQIINWQFEPFGLRLSTEKCFYHPDFFVTYNDVFEVHEVKAFNRKAKAPLVKDDSLVKIKVASTVFQYWVFKIVWFDVDKGLWDARTLK